MPRRACMLIAIGAWTCLATTPAAQTGSTDWDARFRSLPQPSNMRAAMERLSARPHHVGSPYDKDNAEWMLARFKEWGWDAQIEHVRRPVPDAEGARARAGRADARSPRSSRSPSVAVDPTSGQKSEQLPTYNAYSIDGDVTGTARLRQLRPSGGLRGARALGISVKGAIVIARYGELVARHQAEGRRRARRRRLPDLLRSAATTAIGERRRVPDGADASAATACSAAA